MESEIKLENDKLEIEKYNLDELILYINEKNNEKENDTIKIFQKYISVPNIIYNQNNLILFIDELKKQLQLGNNILIPFLDLCPTLIKAYIESELDEEGKDLKYIEVFQLLKINSFISREYLFPVYDYFSDIFYVMNEIEENDKRLKKFNKVFELWKILYYFDMDKMSDFDLSSYCFNGGDLKIVFNNKFLLDNNSFEIEIKFLTNNYFSFNNNLILFLVENDDNSFKIDYNQIKDFVKDKIFNKFILKITKNEIKIKIKLKENENETIIEKNFKVNFEYIKEFYIFKNFIGQIKNIKIKCEEQNKIIINEIFEPYLLNDNNYLYHRKNDKLDKKSEKTNTKNFNEFMSISISNPNLVKVNYINFLDNDFNLYEYLGGFTPFIPFIPLINGIYENTKINTINGYSKKYFLIKIVYNILYLFLKIIKKYYSYFSNYIKKYDIFVFGLIYQINIELILRQKHLEKKEEELYNIIINMVMLNSIIEDDIDFFQEIVSIIFNNPKKEEFINALNCNNSIFMKKFNSDYSEIKNPIFIKSSCQQLFRNIMKNLFIYNRLWSKKEFFFNNNNNKYKLKFKQISYYTQSFQQPLLYPILELNEYIPKFSRFKKEELFYHDFNEKVNYDFNLNKNLFIDIIEQNNPLNNEGNRIKCCLIKKNHHIKGEIIIKVIKENKLVLFEIIFSSFNENNNETCNKNE